MFEHETWNVLFVHEEVGKWVVYCVHCARQMDAGLQSFVILNQYHTDELAKQLDQFALNAVSVTELLWF